MFNLNLCSSFMILKQISTDAKQIPHTLNNTTLSFKDKKDYLNVETDMLCKAVDKNLQYLKEMQL